MAEFWFVDGESSNPIRKKGGWYMARWLMLDIGAGTLDLLVVDGDDRQSY